MSHLQVIVDGEERFNGEVPAGYLPNRDDLFPQALGQGMNRPDPSQVPPLGKLFLLTQLIQTVVVPLLENPLFGQHDVKWHPRGVGSFTITADGPDISMDDLKP